MDIALNEVLLLLRIIAVLHNQEKGMKGLNEMMKKKSISLDEAVVFVQGRDCEHLSCSACPAKKLCQFGFEMTQAVLSEYVDHVDQIITKHYNRHIFGTYDLEDEQKEAIMDYSGDITADLDDLRQLYLGSKEEDE